MHAAKYYSAIIISVLLIAGNLISCPAQTARQVNPLRIIPQPVSISLNKQLFRINTSTVICLGKGMDAEDVTVFKNYLERTILHPIAIITNAKANSIIFRIDTNLKTSPEGYSLSVTDKKVLLTGHDAAGVFYGMQTLLQLIVEPVKHSIKIPGCEITDYPRFGYRGMCLDVSRHMFSVDDLKKWLDVLAHYKLNTFHWHLTDDQGWRIEIKRYPKLQEVAAYRNETLIGHKKEEPHVFDGKRYGGYYTQQQVKSVVAYAAQRHITIIPEIEMPGHSLAALTAYPNLGCTGGPYQTATSWGVFDDVYCAGNEDTFTFLQNVLDEVIALFPSRYIHIGGDECPKIRWKNCPKCQQRIKDEHLKDEHELQSYFIHRIATYLQSKNRQIIGWDEILDGGLAPGATVMSWTGEQGGVAAARQQHTAVMTPEQYVYLDYYQSLNPSEPLAAGGYTPLSKLYNYEPVPKELTTAEISYIKGVQANVWSEYLVSTKQAEYMIFPRMLALAEIAWSSKESRNYPDFLNRLRVQILTLQKLGINMAENFDELTDSVSQDTSGQPKVILNTTLPGAIIRYTTNGTVPNSDSQIYNKPLAITQSSTIKAMIYKDKIPYGRMWQKHVLVHKATGKRVILANQPSGNYNPGAAALVNGIEGTNRYNDKQWCGFSGTDLDAVIDLGSVKRITEIGTNILKYHWQKMWEPDLLTFFVSTNGEHYQEVYQQCRFPINGINPVRATIAAVYARYIRIVGINKGVIPAGEYGAGGKAWLLTDEFIVN